MDELETLDIAPLAEATTRRCGRCGEDRPRNMFYEASETKRAGREGRSRYRGHCRECQREVNRLNQAGRRASLDALKVAAGGCMDCGIFKPEHLEIYDFDHRPGEVKIQPLSLFVTKGTLDEMYAEAAKCDVVCSNCHRIRTRQRGQRLRPPS